MADLVALSPTTPHPSSLAAAADAFLDHHDLACSTRRVYRASLASLVAGLGPTTAVGELSGPRLASWFCRRYAAAAPATWNRELATLRSASPGGGPTAGWPPTPPPASRVAASTLTEPEP